MQIKHDGDGKIYSGSTFLFEVAIKDIDIIEHLHEFITR